MANESDVALQLMQQLLSGATLISGPVLIAKLLPALIVSIPQAVTKVQDMSLTLAPKLAAAVIALTVFRPWIFPRCLGAIEGD